MAVDHYRIRIDGSAQIAVPIAEAVSGIGQGDDLHLGVAKIDPAGWIQLNTAPFDVVHGEIKLQIADLIEAGGDGLVTVHHQGVAAERAGEVAAPAGKAITGIRQGGQDHHAGAVIGAAGRVQIDRPKAADVHGQVIAGYKMGGDGFGAVHQQTVRIGAAAKVVRPIAEVETRVRSGGEVDHGGAVVGAAGGTQADAASAGDVGRQVISGVKDPRDLLMIVHHDIDRIAAAQEVAVPADKAVAGIRIGGEGDHGGAVVNASGRIEGNTAHPQRVESQGVLGDKGRGHCFIAVHGERFRVGAAAQIAAPTAEAVAGIRIGGEGDHGGAVVNASGRIQGNAAGAEGGGVESIYRISRTQRQGDDRPVGIAA